MYKKLAWVLGFCAIVMFILAIIGMASSSSHRWVEPVEEVGWILFVSVVVIDYLLAPKSTLEVKEYSTPERIAWGFGFLAVVLFVVAIISNLATKTPSGWIEAVETAGTLSLLALIIIVVTEHQKETRKEGE